MADTLLHELMVLSDSVSTLGNLSGDAPVIAYVILAACIALLLVNLLPRLR